MGLVALGMAGFVAFATAGLGAGVTPWLVPVALIVASVGYMARRLRIERGLLEAEDPAAGSEIFTIRGALRQVRTAVSAVVARVRTVRPVWVLVAGLLVIAGVTATKLIAIERAPTAQLAAGPGAVTPGASPTLTPTVGPTGSRFTVEPAGQDGELVVTLDLLDEQPIEIPALAGLSEVPSGWQARVVIAQLEGGALQFTLLGDVPATTSLGDAWSATARSCGIAPQPFGLRVQGSPGHYVFRLAPQLTPTSCQARL
jgi:hypothetical protein